MAKVECLAGEAGPATAAALRCRAHVEPQEQEREPVGDARCQGSTVEAEVERVDKEVVE